MAPPNQKSQPTIVVALVGVSGSGKSRFVDVLTGTTQWARASQAPDKSPLKSVKAAINHGGESIDVVLVDTPGIVEEDSDVEPLRKLDAWLKKHYKNASYLTGILYLHRITDNRSAGVPKCEERTLQKIWGKQEYGIRVRFVTTMWDKVTQDLGDKREKELRECRQWKTMLKAGAQIARFDNSEEAAEAIILDLLGLERGRSVQQWVQEHDLEPDTVLLTRQDISFHETS